jgi:hypothetical protein
LEQEDLDIANQAGYNPEAVKFQFDFLNDDESKLPEGLRAALAANKPIIFFNNPPYGTANSLEFSKDNTKSDMAATRINAEMLEKKIGASAQQLYAQFLYRMMTIVRQHNLTNCRIGAFTGPIFMSGKSFKGFRKEFFKTFAFKDGMLFQASHFADVADSWGISFTLFSA